MYLNMFDIFVVFCVSVFISNRVHHNSVNKYVHDLLLFELMFSHQQQTKPQIRRIKMNKTNILIYINCL